MKAVLTFVMLIAAGLSMIHWSHTLTEATQLGTELSEWGATLKSRGMATINVAFGILIFAVIDLVRLRFFNIVDLFKNRNGWEQVSNEVKAAFALGWFVFHSVVIYVFCMGGSG